MISHPVLPTRAVAVLAWVLVAVLAVGGCASRGATVGDVRGSLGAVIVESAGPGSAAAGAPVLVDSVSFARLGELAGGNVLAEVIAAAGVGSAGVSSAGDSSVGVTAASAADVLVCPDRAPCHVRDNATWLSVWDAVLTGDRLDVVVGRTWNVQRLYRMTESEVTRLTLERDGAGWRLVARSRLPT